MVKNPATGRFTGLVQAVVGTPPETVSTQPATALPALINHLTPKGTVPSDGGPQQALDALKPKPAPA